MSYLIFLSAPYNDIINGVENYLSLYLAKEEDVICFAHPQFLKSVSNLLRNKKISEKISSSFYIYHSIGFFPFGRTLKIVNNFNYKINFLLFRYLTRKNNFWKQDLKVITFTPEFVYIEQLLNNLKGVFYYITDNYQAMPCWKKYLQKKQFHQLEEKMITICNKIIVVSINLLNKYKLSHRNVLLFPTPSHSELFRKYKRNRNDIPLDIIKIPTPIVGFIGNYFDWKIDTEFIINLAQRFKWVSFVFLGSIKLNKSLSKKLLSLPNIFYLGYKKGISELPKYVDKFEVCMVPYRTNSWGKSAYPVKIMEYLALGKPVVTTALPSLKYLGDKSIIYWSKNNDFFMKNITQALEERSDSKLISRRINEAINNGWGMKIKYLTDFLNERS